jgi:copper(I)-binding protein
VRPRCHAVRPNTLCKEFIVGIPSPPRLRSRTAPVLLGAALVATTLAACSAGQNAETAQETPDTAGVPGSVGSMVLDDVYLETSRTVPTGGSVPLRGAFTDESPNPDRLIGVTTPAATTVELLTSDGTTAPDGLTVSGYGQVDATTGPVLIRLTGLRGPLSPEAIVPLTFQFATAGQLTIDDVPVRGPRSPGGRASVGALPIGAVTRHAVSPPGP